MDHAVHEIWHWVISKNNWLSATHIPGFLNVEAGKEYRKEKLRTEWMLNRQSLNLSLRSWNLFQQLTYLHHELILNLRCLCRTGQI